MTMISFILSRVKQWRPKKELSGRLRDMEIIDRRKRGIWMYT